MNVRSKMPRPDGFRRASEGYLDSLAADGYAEKTLRGYAYALHRAHQTLMTLGTPPSPKRFGEPHKRALYATYKHDPWLIRTMNVCLRKMGVRMLIPAVEFPPRRVRWLTKDHAKRLLDASFRLGPPYSILVHLELQNGFRRVSVERAKVRDLKTNPIYVRGKGKDYTMVPHPDLKYVLMGADAWRGERGFVSEWVLPVRSYGYEHPRSEQGLDLILRTVAQKAGVVASHHDLRRTFGRSLWEAGVKIEVISAQMGHESIETTRRYLGINLIDQAEAMTLLARWESDG